MNADDSKAWIAYHGAAFPSWSQMMNRLRDETRREAFARITREFDGLTLQQVKKATDVLARWENHPKIDQHVYHVANIARNTSERHVPQFDERGLPVYRCHRCHDSGLAYVFVGCLPRTRERYVSLYGDSERTAFMRTTIACCCESANVRNRWLQDRDEVMVYAWETMDWIKVNEPDKYDRVMYGLAVAQTWATKPEEF